MTHLLKRGPLTFAEIANELDGKLDSIVKAASRGVGTTFTKVLSPDGITRLALVERWIA